LLSFKEDERAMKSRAIRWICVLVTVSLFSACAPQETQVIEKEVTRIVTEKTVETVVVESTPQVVEKEVTKVVEVEKVVTATPEPGAGPAAGGTVIVALYQEPQALNPFLVNQGAATRVRKTIQEGLLGIAPCRRGADVGEWGYLGRWAPDHVSPPFRDQVERW
jgi:hypothetical protein